MADLYATKRGFLLRDTFPKTFQSSILEKKTNLMAGVLQWLASLCLLGPWGHRRWLFTRKVKPGREEEEELGWDCSLTVSSRPVRSQEECLPVLRRPYWVGSTRPWYPHVAQSTLRRPHLKGWGGPEGAGSCWQTPSQTLGSGVLS